MRLLTIAENFSEIEANPANVVWPDDSLTLSLSNLSQHQPARHSSTEIMNRIMSDDYALEFSQTITAIQFVTDSLVKFAEREQINPTDQAGNENLITNWLKHQTSISRQQQQLNHAVESDHHIGSIAPNVERIANELDFIYGNFWTRFRQLMLRVIEERPMNGINNINLAFRCERYQELNALVELASVSSIYRLILDTFSNELYTHCLIRKLAQLKLYQIKPSSILRQFVDIYLDLPAINQVGAIQERALMQFQLARGLNFDLKFSFARHGPLTKVAELVLDEHSALKLNNSKSSDDNYRLVQRFSQDCHKYRSDLGKIWSTFDEMASFLSSPSNDLSNFNHLVKLVAPQLVYGTVCGLLVQSNPH